MKPLPTVRAALLAELEKARDPWLVEGLWMREAVGIIGGEPKCGKSFLALDLAVAVAAGIPCLRHFPAQHSGPVLLYAAEDAAPIVRQRLELTDAQYVKLQPIFQQRLSELQILQGRLQQSASDQERKQVLRDVKRGADTFNSQVTKVLSTPQKSDWRKLRDEAREKVE